MKSVNCFDKSLSNPMEKENKVIIWKVKDDEYPAKAIVTYTVPSKTKTKCSANRSVNSNYYCCGSVGFGPCQEWICYVCAVLMMFQSVLHLYQQKQQKFQKHEDSNNKPNCMPGTKPTEYKIYCFYIHFQDSLRNRKWINKTEICRFYASIQCTRCILLSLKTSRKKIAFCVDINSNQLNCVSSLVLIQFLIKYVMR